MFCFIAAFILLQIWFYVLLNKINAAIKYVILLQHLLYMYFIAHETTPLGKIGKTLLLFFKQKCSL